jgi:hypothetical protein
MQDFARHLVEPRSVRRSLLAVCNLFSSNQAGGFSDPPAKLYRLQTGGKPVSPALWLEMMPVRQRILTG